MKMTPKVFLIAAILVVVITLVAVNWDMVQAAVLKKKATDAVKTPTPNNGLPSATNPLTPAPKVGTRDYSKLLKKGSYTPLSGEVKELQTMLNNVNAAKKIIALQLVPDNNFGSKTEAMLLQYAAGVREITLAQAYAIYQKAIGL